MLRFSDAHHFRKIVAGFCMMAFPLLLLVAMIVHPERKSDEAAQLAVVADNLDAWYVSHLLALVALVLALPAVLGLMHMLREREAAWGHLGGGLAIVGLMATFGLVTVDGLVQWQAGSGESAAMTALFERLNDTAGFVIPVYVASLGFALGALALAIGLYRARAIQSWMAVLIPVGVVCLAIGGIAASDVAAIAGAAVLLVGFGALGRRVMEETDSEWEQTPEVKDFRPLPGL